MTLPPLPDESEDGLFQGTEYFKLDGNQDAPITEETYAAIVQKIEELENTAKAIRERALLMEQIRHEKESEQELLMHFATACDHEEEVCEMIFEIEDWQSLLNNGFVFAKQMMSSPKEINWKT